jgi:hypothetical protein
MIIFAVGIAWVLDGLGVQLAGNAGSGSIVDMEFREHLPSSPTVPLHVFRDTL